MGVKRSPARLETRARSQTDCGPFARQMATLDSLGHETYVRWREYANPIFGRLLNDEHWMCQPRLSVQRHRILIAGCLIGRSLQLLLPSSTTTLLCQDVTTTHKRPLRKRPELVLCMQRAFHPQADHNSSVSMLGGPAQRPMFRRASPPSPCITASDGR
jgi:hypothetical protein